MGFGVHASQTAVRSFCPGVQVAAVAAAPDHFIVTTKDSVLLNVGKQAAVALFVLFLGNLNGVPQCGDGWEAFITGNRSKRRVKITVFLMLAVG